MQQPEGDQPVPHGASDCRGLDAQAAEAAAVVPRDPDRPGRERLAVDPEPAARLRPAAFARRDEAQGAPAAGFGAGWTHQEEA
ncbi:hypothetical protein [Streptomyces sp. NPDC002580]|uniref:hypothetical protein n=1 Tax=Streptomyces sp. NPDC002580 TaxID=3364653 RepID=UPI0036B45127